MNITHVSVAETEVPASWVGVVESIFAHHKLLMDKYKDIEQLPEPPVSVHHKHGQRILKDFAWRTVEELAESAEAWIKHAGDFDTSREHALEELADATHFFVELCWFAGVTARQCTERVPMYPNHHHADVSIDMIYWQVTYRVGLAMNFLRNKPWKQTQVPTDEARFRAAVLDAFEALVRAWADQGESATTLWTFYMKKHKVNEFRQRSNY